MNPKEGGSFVTFEQMFSVREQNEALGAKVLDISGYQPEGTVYFSPGWNSDINDYKNPISQLYFASKRVVSAEIAGDEEEKADAINKLLVEKGIEETDFIAHSVGSISTVLAAEKFQGKVGKVILINPPSMIGADESTDLIRRYKSLMKEEGEQKTDVGNSVSRRSFFDMAKTITEFDMYAHILKLKAQGVDVITAHCAGDRLFPAGKVCIEARTRGWDNFVIEQGGHMSVGALMNGAIKYLKRN